jgi:pimeloyl-ACP methyl ester carboxylesterase
MDTSGSRLSLKKVGYAPVNGLKMHYEITGEGDPLIYIPAAFAFSGMTEFPELTKRWRVVQVDVQGHGRTADRDTALSFDQHVSDILGLMDHLEIARADFLGWSYGGLVATLIALRYPERVRRVVTYGALYGPPQDAIRPEMFGPPVEQKPDGDAHRFARDHFMRVAPDPGRWPVFWKKLMDLMPVSLTSDELASIKSRILVSVGDNDFISLEHAIYAFRHLKNAELAVIPDATHFLLYDKPHKLEPLISEFLTAPEERLPFGTIATGFQPGKTR